MDASRLATLSTDTLTRLQDAIKAELASRFDTAVRVGRIAEFEHPVGTMRKMVITRINGKTISGEETADSVKPFGKWRVGKTQLKVIPIARSTKAPVAATAPITPTKPATAGAGSW